MSDEPAGELGFVSLDPAAGMFQTLRRELGATSLGLNAITLEPGQRLRVHRHERQEEVYLVLDGELTLIAEGEPHVLRRDDLARVGPGLKRQLTNPTAEPVRLIVFGAYGEHQGRDGIAWTGWDDEGDGKPPQEVPLPEPLP